MHAIQLISTVQSSAQDLTIIWNVAIQAVILICHTNKQALKQLSKEKLNMQHSFSG